MIGALEREFNSEQNEQTRSQIEYMENQIKELKLEDEQLYKAYLADVFDENEYAERRGFIKDQQQKLQAEMSRLETGLMSVDQFEERKQEILKICQNAANSGLVFDAPFEVRQRIVKTIIDKITLNANEGWFELEGVISGQYLFENNNEDASHEGPNDQNNPSGEVGQIVCNPKDTDSLPQSIESLRKMSASLWRG